MSREEILNMLNYKDAKKIISVKEKKATYELINSIFLNQLI